MTLQPHTPGMSRRTLARAGLMLAGTAVAAAAPATGVAPAGRIQALVPDLEAYIQSTMPRFGVPGAAVAIVSGDRTVYSKGFGLRRKDATDPVTPDTVFQAGSTTKAFLATMLAIAVDRGKLRWDDRVVDLDPGFSLYDPYVTREFRVFDLLAQRSGLNPYANDFLVLFGYDPDWLAKSLRYAQPVSSFRSTFAYTNITHLIAGRIVSRALDAPDWPTLATREIMQPLGMTGVTFTAEAIGATPDHATGHLWTAQGPVPVPFHPIFPYSLGPAGDINTSVQLYTRWLRLQLGNGVFEGRRLVSAENLAVTRTTKVALNDVTTYAMGWIISLLPNGRAVWHNGGTEGFGAHVGFVPDHDAGLVVLSNQENKGFPDAVGMWFYERLLGGGSDDPADKALAHLQDQAGQEQKRFTRPASPAPAPDLASLAGDYECPAFGPAAVGIQPSGLVATLKQTGARIRLDPFDGAVFVGRLIPEGRSAAIAGGRGSEPFGFINFQADRDGRLNRMQLTCEDQAYIFSRT